MNKIIDFTDADRWMAETALKRHYGRRVGVEPADSEIRIDPAAAEVTVCPTYYWEQHGVGYVIYKVADDRYRSRFFYSAHEYYGTGPDFDNLAECVSDTLRLQTEHAKVRAAGHGRERTGIPAAQPV